MGSGSAVVCAYSVDGVRVASEQPNGSTTPSIDGVQLASKHSNVSRSNAGGRWAAYLGVLGQYNVP